MRRRWTISKGTGIDHPRTTVVGPSTEDPATGNVAIVEVEEVGRPGMHEAMDLEQRNELEQRISALDRLKRDLRGDIDELRAKASSPATARRKVADLEARAVAFEDLATRLP